jgi:hypothetical protein
MAAPAGSAGSSAQAAIGVKARMATLKKFFIG